MNGADARIVLQITGPIHHLGTVLTVQLSNPIVLHAPATVDALNAQQIIGLAQ
jgi:hypothetical protein